MHGMGKRRKEGRKGATPLPPPPANANVLVSCCMCVCMYVVSLLLLAPPVPLPRDWLEPIFTSLESRSFKMRKKDKRVPKGSGILRTAAAAAAHAQLVSLSLSLLLSSFWSLFFGKGREAKTKKKKIGKPKVGFSSYSSSSSSAIPDEYICGFEWRIASCRIVLCVCVCVGWLDGPHGFFFFFCRTKRRGNGFSSTTTIKSVWTNQP